MRINAVTINNFLSHRTVAQGVPGDANLVLVAGPNGSGKSAMLQAIRLAFSGDPQRGLTKKNELDQLRTLGAPKGFVSVGTTDGQFDLSLPSGTHTKPPTQAHPMLPFVLDPEAYFRLDQSARRSTLMKAAGVRPTRERIVADLTAAGHDAQLVADIDFSTGFANAEKQAKEGASDARGRWKYVTSETYGEKKADVWVAPAPQLDPDLPDEETAAHALSDLREAHTKAHTKVAVLKSRRDAAARAEEASTLLKSEEAVSEELAEWIKQRDNLQAEIAQLTVDATTKGGHVFKCPCCAEQLVIDSKNQVTKYVAPKGGSAARAAERLAEIKPLMRTYEDNIAPLERKMAAIESARMIHREAVEAPTAADIEEAEAQLREIMPKISNAEIALRRIQNHQADVDAAATRTRQAAEAHGQVSAYTALAEAIVALPGKYVGEAVDALNAFVAEITEGAFAENGPAIVIDTEGDLMFGPVRYDMASESQQWRMATALAYAIARATGIGLFAMDRFDVIQPSERGDILAFFEGQGDVQAWLFGTLKAPYKPDNGICIWLGDKA